MGAKDSKPCCISYDDALKRVSELELRRLRDAFKRTSTLNGTMTKQAFIKEVLGDGVPLKLAEHIFQACGGSQKGINFKELLSGLVLLTRGTQEEKIRFIFGLYANEAGTHVSKEDMVKLVQACEGGYIPEAVADCFLENEKVPYTDFCEWLSEHPNATSLTRWLLSEPCSVSLSNDLETPTFYQTLSGVTHLEETDIIELEKRYWMLKNYSRSGKFDTDTLVPLICPPVPLSLCEGFFNAFDENRDGHIDFKEMACGVSACCRGPVVERQKFCFKIFDRDRDGALNRSEVEQMVEALILIQSENRDSSEWDFKVSTDCASPQAIVSDILANHDANKDGAITLDEYLVWSVSNSLPQDFLDLLFQVCHIVLGLRPANKQEEGEVVRGWLAREDRRGYQPGQVWYLISMEWWRAWKNFIDYQPDQNGTSSTELANCLNTSFSSLNSSGSGNGGSLPGTLKRTKLQKKVANAEGTIVHTGESNGVVITGINTFLGDSESFSSSDHYTTSSTSSLASLCLIPSLTSNKFSNTSTGLINNRSASGCSTPNQSPRPGRRIASSSSGNFPPPQRPGAIDNNSLIISNTQKVMMLTGEGGKLKRNMVLMRGRDFELFPEPLWKALSQWYGGSPALPRQVIVPKNSEVPELELYPLCIRLFRHQQQVNNRLPVNTWSGMVGGYGYGYPSAVPTAPKRYLAYTASFSRLATLKQVFDFLSMRLRIRGTDMRLWLYRDENEMSILEDDDMTLEDLMFEDNEQVLIEVRNKDQTWPEELSSITGHSFTLDKSRQAPAEKGATGLNNLGNTCFMNAALQCVSNTRPLTQYFINNMHLYELNRTNPLGMKGHIAKRYGDLVRDLWSGSSKTIAPLKLRWTIGKYAPRFNGFQQHDSQELLAFLLDGLHEDLNRVHDKPYVELKDSDGRSDVVVAEEAWENHILRNKSIIVDLFHGQLKSCVRCKVCGHESVCFDPFNYLSLPLPMESCVHIEAVVIRLDGSVPVKYGLRLNMDEKYHSIKHQLSLLCGIPAEQLMLAEVASSTIKNVPLSDQKIKMMVGGSLFAYEIPPPTELICEDLHHNKYKELQTLTQIQRMERSDIAYRTRPPPTYIDLPAKNGGNTQYYNNHIQPSSNIDEGVGSEESSQTTEEVDPNISPVKHCRNPSSLSTASTTSSIMSSSVLSTNSQSESTEPFPGFVISFHRKMNRQDVYFLSSQKTRPSLFGLPLVLPCHEMTTHQDLYRAVWIQVARLVSPLPPSEANIPNHAQDCDDSLGYEYPFALKAVQKDGLVCAWCPWYRFCRGCKLECCDADFNSATCFIAIDWDPTALHLRYQTAQEKAYVDHSSVEQARNLQTEPIDLDTCLRAFTKEEELGEDEKYYCSKCKQHQLASKKLQIWRLPPVLIIHLKRFQFVNGRWVKSQKIVRFPHQNFNPTKYLATIPREEVVSHYNNEHPEICDSTNTTSLVSHNEMTNNAINNSRQLSSGDEDSLKQNLKREIVPNGICVKKFGGNTMVLQDFQQHRLMDSVDPCDLNYQLYAISCHTGILGGGHYVCYACNTNNKWYCYNDSSCKELTANQIDSDAAYMLFYERQGIDYEKYMPNVAGKVPDTRDLDDEMDSDLRKLCCIQ